MYQLLRFILLTITIATLSALSVNATCNSTIYVNINVQGGQNNGNSWTNAYVDLQSALDEAQSCSTIQTIWVAEGIYRPTVDLNGGTTSGSQNLVFNIDFDVKLYGGFCGWESELYERTKHLCPTILSGDHNEDDIYTDNINSPDFPFINSLDNSYNIMRLKNLTTSCIIDGFTFMGGDADHPSTLSKQIGGAIFNDGRGLNDISNPKINNCTFQYNQSLEGGGAVYNYGLGGDASITFDACEFKFNLSNADGGAIYHLGEVVIDRINTKFTSCLFLKNKSLSNGGAFYGKDQSASSSSIATQCTFVFNMAEAGAGVFMSSPSSVATPEMELKGSIFYNNTATSITGISSFDGDNVLITASYSLFPEASQNNSNFNINTNPRFINASNNFRLTSISPAINTGGPGPSPHQGSFLPIDLDGNARRLGPKKDMGAYEYLLCPTANKIYVNRASETRVTGQTPFLALTSLNMALKMACNCTTTPEIHLSEGVYIPHRLEDLSIAEDRTTHSFFIECPVSIIGHGNVIISGDILQNNQPFANPIDSIRNDNCDILFTASEITGISLDSIEIRNANQAAITTRYSQSIMDTISLSIKNTYFRYNYNNCIAMQSNSSAHINLEIQKCDFYRNSILGAKHSDGCVEISTASKYIGLIEDCTFTDNQLGGIYLYTSDSSSTIINRCLFSENESYIGAGIEISNKANETSFYEITNCVFKDNTGQSNGAAIYARRSYDTHVDISNCTFYNNYTSARTAGAVNFFNLNGSATIKNSIFWKNMNNLGEQSISGDVDVSHTLIGEEACFTGNGTRCNEAMLYNTDPLFVEEFGTFGSNLKLKSTSPAINKGNIYTPNDFVSVDIENKFRHVGRIDLGAYEFQNPDCLTSITNPIIPPGTENSVSLEAQLFIELSNEYNTPSGGVLFLDADNVIIEPSLTVEQGAIVEINVTGCNDN